MTAVAAPRRVTFRFSRHVSRHLTRHVTCHFTHHLSRHLAHQLTHDLSRHLTHDLSRHLTRHLAHHLTRHLTRHLSRHVGAHLGRHLMRGLGSALLGGVLLAATLLARAEPATPPADRRGEDLTFLSFPARYWIHSPAEYADYVQQRSPTGYPFWRQIRQLWQSYGAAVDATSAYPLNVRQHALINAVAAGTTVEYALRAAYETVIGRVTERWRKHGPTEEETYGAFVAQDYVDFIRVRPWYEYPYARRLAGLWRETNWFGPDALRKWERRYVLTSEYAIKAASAWLFRLSNQGSSSKPGTTLVVVDRLPDGRVSLPGFKTLHAAPGGWLASMPRHDAFKEYAMQLARAHVGFREIAGNGAQAPILISVLAPKHWQVPAPAHALIEQPIVTQPERKRVALIVQVGTLAPTLRSFSAEPIELEHIYDY
jgi:hypothetical protein